MYKIKRFIDCHVPVNLCNFKCDYCMVGQCNAFKKEYTNFEYPVDTMAYALRPERMGGICAINLCGNGETFLHPQLMDFIKLLLRDGHFVSIVTNGTVTKAIDELCKLDVKERSRVFIKFSFHYTELVRLNLLNVYFNNIHNSHKAGISYTVELVASDGNVPYIDEIKKVCMENLGCLCHLTDPRANTTDDIRHLTNMPMDEHLKVWGSFNSALFDYRQATWGHDRKKHFCYGGLWSFNLNLSQGDLKQCYRNSGVIQNIFEHPTEDIHYLPIGHHCRVPHCYNSHVFDCFAGVIPEIPSPTYAELRNRVLPGGDEWLKGPYKEIYSHRVCENNEPYIEERQIFADGINMLNYTMETPGSDFTESVHRCLSNMSEKSVAVFGENRVAEHLLFICDKLKKYQDSSDANVVVVTDYLHYGSIKQTLSKKTNATIINIVDLSEML